MLFPQKCNEKYNSKPWDQIKHLHSKIKALIFHHHLLMQESIAQSNEAKLTNYWGFFIPEVGARSLNFAILWDKVWTTDLQTGLVI